MRHRVEHTCCRKQAVRRGFWSPDEDMKLIRYITAHGHGCWSSLPERAGLQRCGKSCRLRWMNYLRPGIKRGNFSKEEENIIIYLHTIMENRWAQIAKHLPGRTDSEIKNYWNSCLKKKTISGPRLGESSQTTAMPNLDFDPHRTIAFMSSNIFNNVYVNDDIDSDTLIQSRLEAEVSPSNPPNNSMPAFHWTHNSVPLLNIDGEKDRISCPQSDHAILMNNQHSLHDNQENEKFAQHSCPQQLIGDNYVVNCSGYPEFCFNPNYPSLPLDNPQVDPAVWPSSYSSSSNQLQESERRTYGIMESPFNMLQPDLMPDDLL
eukprot:Gb_35539 [translate_table: standard]